jgi:hypothetical protein
MQRGGCRLELALGDFGMRQIEGNNRLRRGIGLRLLGVEQRRLRLLDGDDRRMPLAGRQSAG